MAKVTVLNPKKTSRKKRVGSYRYWLSQKNKKWYFHFLAANNRITDPSQGYASKQGVIKAIKSDQRSRINALIIHLKMA
ncbi:MAG TPA: YegP family protein [Alphaproteobacteria bacterium]|nr:YegP family protein [Alphaproteobacteria bacterium]